MAKQNRRETATEKRLAEGLLYSAVRDTDYVQSEALIPALKLPLNSAVRDADLKAAWIGHRLREVARTVTQCYPLLF